MFFTYDKRDETKGAKVRLWYVRSVMSHIASIQEIFLQDYLKVKILKHSLQNFKNVRAKYFLCYSN